MGSNPIPRTTLFKAKTYIIMVRALTQIRGVISVVHTPHHAWIEQLSKEEFSKLKDTYFALINKNTITTTNEEHHTTWFDIQTIPKLGFDHNKIIDYAIQRLKWKFEYTTAAFSLLPKQFTMSQVQELYEIVFQKEFDKRNFRKKLLSLDILKEEGLMKQVSFRPPMFYTLKEEIPAHIDIL
jgi:hypothetical protein